MNVVKIIINRSQIPAIKPGTIFIWDGTVADFEFEEGDAVIDAIVVMGDTAYKNGRKLRLYVQSPFTSLITTNPNRVPFNTTNQRRY